MNIRDIINRWKRKRELEEIREKCKPLIIDMISNEDDTKYIKVEDVNNIIDRFIGYLDEDMIYRIKYKIKQFADTVSDV